jgi:hypothetical protein
LVADQTGTLFASLGNADITAIGVELDRLHRRRQQLISPIAAVPGGSPR